MKKCYKFLTILLLAFPVDLIGQTLDDYLVEAAKNNPGLQASYSKFQSSIEMINQVRTLDDPTFSFGYFINPIETRVGAQQAKISLTQMLPWFGTLKAKENEAALMSEVAYQDFVKSKNELFLSVKKAYYPIYEINEHIKWQKENLAILTTYKKLATTAFSNSKGAMVDIIKTDIMIENTKTDIQLLSDNLEVKNVVFNNLINLPKNNDIVVDGTLSPPTLVWQQIDSVISENQLLYSMDLKISAANAKTEVARKNGFPKIGVGLDYAFINTRTNVDIENNGRNALMPMVSMSLPIFRKKYESSVKRTQLVQEALIFERQELENDLNSELERIKYELKKNKDLHKHYDQQITKSQQALNLLNSAYSHSGKDFDEVLRMQQQVLKYEISKATALKDFYIALAELNFITSK